jgi:hypothetical protein
MVEHDSVEQCFVLVPHGAQVTVPLQRAAPRTHVLDDPGCLLFEGFHPRWKQPFEPEAYALVSGIRRAPVDEWIVQVVEAVEDTGALWHERLLMEGMRDG